MLSWRQTVASCVTWSHKLYDYRDSSLSTNYRNSIISKIVYTWWIFRLSMSKFTVCLFTIDIQTHSSHINDTFITSVYFWKFYTHIKTKTSMIQLPMRYKKSLTNFTHSTNRSQRSLSRAPSLDIFALKTRLLTYRIFRTRSKMQILVLKQRLSALGYTHDVNTCSDAEGLASVACTHTFLLTSPTDTCVS